MTQWLNLAFERRVVVRAVKYAVTVGPLLIAINHGDIIAAGGVTGWLLFKMALTVIVPYAVSTFSGVGVLLEQR